MKLAKSLFVLPLLVLAAPLVAEDPKPSDSSSEKDPERVICKTQEVIGSRLRKRKVCMTAAEWREVGFRSGQSTERKEVQIGRDGGG